MIINNMMRKQLSLLDTPVKRTHHAEQLNRTARRLIQVKTALQQLQDGATAEELAVFLGLRKAQVGPALSELWRMDEVVKTDARRPTIRGVFVTVWMVAQQ